MVPRKLTNLLVADPDDATRKRVARCLTLMILVFAQRIRKQTYIALSHFFRVELEEVAAERRAQRAAATDNTESQDPDSESVPPELGERCTGPLCWEQQRTSSMFLATSCVLDGFCVLRASARLGRALSKQV